MNVKQLKEALKDKSDDLDVFFEQTNDEFRYSLLEKVTTREITFADGKLKAKETCLVLTDDLGDED
ncbi:MAG: hypothetical protein WC756_12165 [Taibaiella sp.]|jgi:hypothetical protein